MIDSDYDGESFFVRHCYFTGGQKPYEKLKRALKAEIEEDAWTELYGTVSRPFVRPSQRPDRRQGHQRLRRRGAEGLQGLTRGQRSAGGVLTDRPDLAARATRAGVRVRSRARGWLCAAPHGLGRRRDVRRVDRDRCRAAPLRSWT